MAYKVIMKAFNEGGQAFRKKIACHNNPYTEEMHDEKESWEEGWMDQSRVHEAIRDANSANVSE